MVATSYLAEGIVRFLEAAHQSLSDAILLYRHKKYASSCILGVIAAEHIGQAIGLRHLRLSPSLPECAELKRRPKHEERLRRALTIIEHQLPQSTSLDDIDALLRAAETYKGRTPRRFHELRTRAQYVEPSDDCSSWSTPTSIGPQDVYHLLLNVGNNYRNLLLGLLQDSEVEAEVVRLDLRQTLEATSDIWP
ncbi:MAG TPA: AbiV family abortive infection protein [Terriglobales bacterium]|nr:AbiV family abortive infection protein [Terriglobales bacterium]